MDEAAARVRPFISAENEMGALDGIGNHLRLPAVLHAAGITAELSREVELVAVGEDGTEVALTVRANDDAWVTPEWRDADTVNHP